MSVLAPPRGQRADPVEPRTPEEVAGRRRMLGVLGVLAVWVVGWLLMRGRQNLDLAVSAQTDVHRWLLDMRDEVEASRDANVFLEYVVGGISSALDWVVSFLQETFSQPAFPRPVPEVGWLGVLALAVLAAYAFAGARMAVFVAASMLAFGFLGYWAESVDLLIVTGVAVCICVAIGLPLGIWMSRSERVTAVLTPVLDVMQTMPAFAYLTPLVLFFGIGPASAVVTTVIYALPPLVRISAHGLRSVSPTTIEATTSMGSTSPQLLRKVQLPMARRTVIVGLNQTTMAALSIATIAALIDGPGLGEPVVQALQSLDVGEASVSGLCIVIMAIMLDRTTTAASERAAVATRVREDPRVRKAVLILLGVLALVAVWLSRTYTRYAEFPESPALGQPLADGINTFSDWVIETFGDITKAFTDLISYGLLNPFESLLAESPWWLMAAVLVSLAYLLGGRNALPSTIVCLAIILATGLWNDSMETLAMTLVGTLLVMALGVVVGVWMARSRGADAIIRPLLDALQTLPPFVYLVPALALFGPTRFMAIVAAILYAAPVAIKIVADGVRAVPAATVEAAESGGSSSWQMITKVQLPMARGALVLAANQGLLFVLSMVVIGALVGGGALGILVINGFSQAEDFGKGLAAGIAITALGVMLDRITVHTAARYGRAQQG